MRDSGHADRYQQMKVKYIDHHNPDLILFDKDDVEMQRIDLTRLRTTANIHKLCQMLGLRERCRDEHSNCADWHKSGQCDANPQFMHQSCRRACGLCKESDNQSSSTVCRNSAEDSECEYWSTMGECTRNQAFMHQSCARSCGICQVAEERPMDADDDDDDGLGKDEL